MQCEKFERRLQVVLDDRGRPEDDPDLRRHAEICPGCQSLFAAQQMLWAGLAELEFPQLRADFADFAVRESTRAVSPSKASLGVSIPRAARTKNQTFWWITAIAVLLIAPVVYLSFGTADIPDTPPITIGQDDSAGPQQEREKRVEALTQIAGAENRSPVTTADSALREEQYAELLDRWRLQLAETSGRLGLTNADTPTAQGAAAVSQITHRLRMPLSASIESTLNVLRSALPSSNAEKNQAKPQAQLYEAPANRLV